MGGEFEKKDKPWIYTVYVTLKGIIFMETRFVLKVKLRLWSWSLVDSVVYQDVGWLGWGVDFNQHRPLCWHLIPQWRHCQTFAFYGSEWK